VASDLPGVEDGVEAPALEAAVSEGASFADLGRSLCYAAALRVARFGTASEHADWETAHHVFTYCNAVHQGLKRIGSYPDLGGHFVESVRAILHGATAIYLIRYLNVPPARLTAATTSRQWLKASSGNSIPSMSQIGDFMVVLTPCLRPFWRCSLLVWICEFLR